MFMIRNVQTGQAAPLVAEGPGAHPSWVHWQCGTRTESELKNLVDRLDVADFLRRGDAGNGIGVFLDIPNGALAWKRADPFQGARWIFDEEDLVEALELDPEIVVRVPEHA
jgi:hypothetical protein